jgi:acyl-CoA thioester hydrolase
VFQHVNNVNYFSYFDTAVTYYEMTEKVVGLMDGPTHCVVAEVACRYHSSLAFPDRVAVGIRVARIGGSSVRYEIGVFRNDEDVAAAEGYFVHVFVARGSQKPVPIPDEARTVLSRIAV